MSQDAPAPTNAEVGAETISDEELEAILAEREKQEREEANQAAGELALERPCPVCGAALEAVPFQPALPGFLIGRPPMKCALCEVRTPGRASFVGWALALTVAIALALSGMSLIFKAQRITETGPQRFAFAGGALLFVSGLFIGYGVHGAGNKKQTAQRILDHRRRREADEREEEEKKKKAKERVKKGTKKEDEPAEDEAKGEAGFFQENLEAIVVAIILALIIRHFAMEAFVIPTGSMAPTLLGDHFRLTCTNCEYPFEVSKTESEFAAGPERDLNRTCPTCLTSFNTEVTPADVYGGHKILVNKFVYKSRAPRRYEIIVFKYPKHPWRNYIKRLVGLPGEQIQILNGDLYANGVLARKPDHVQDAVWIPVWDARYARKDPTSQNAWFPLADGEEPREVWSFDRDGRQVVCKPGKTEGAPLTWLAYQRQIKDVTAYNANWQGHNPVADLRVRAKVTPQDGAIVRLAVMEKNSDEGGHDFRRLLVARFPAGSGDKVFGVEANGPDGALALQAQKQLPALKPGVPVELTLSYADDRARLQINGETVLAWDDIHAPSQTALSNVRVGVEGGDALIEDLRIDRDIYYVAGSGGRQYDPAVGPVKVPADSFFCMGDNSPNSADGREWGFVHEGNLIGRAFLVFWPVVPFELQFIR